MNQFDYIENKATHLIGRPVSLVGYIHGQSVDDIFCLVRDLEASRYFRVPVSEIYTDGQTALLLFGGGHV